MVTFELHISLEFVRQMVRILKNPHGIVNTPFVMSDSADLD